MRNKHKKLKKRYNELENYLYNDDNDEEEKPQNEVLNEVKPKQELKQNEQIKEEPQEQTPQQPSNVQYQYVKSWRNIGHQ